MTAGHMVKMSDSEMAKRFMNYNPEEEGRKKGLKVEVLM
jgi:hypothetical protein